MSTCKPSVTWEEAVDRYGRIVDRQAHRLASGIDWQDLRQQGYLWLGENLADISRVEESGTNTEAWITVAMKRHMPEWREAEHVRLRAEKPVSFQADEDVRESPLDNLLAEYGLPVPAESGLPEYSDDPEKYLVRCVMWAIDQLTDREKEVFLGVHLDGKGQTEIARELGISPRICARYLASAVKKVHDLAMSEFSGADALPKERPPKRTLHSSSEGWGGRA